MYAIIQRASAIGSSKILDTIQSIRHGSTKEEVRKIMARDPAIIPAGNLPEWIKAVDPDKEDGECWYFYMDYPPRNLILYFGKDGKVVFTTWSQT